MHIDTVQKIIIVNKDNSILLLKRSASDKKRPLTWDLPGGHAEENELLPNAIIRETLEETGLAVSSPQLVYTTTTYHEWEGNKATVLRLFYVAMVDSTKDTIQLSHEHEAYVWCSKEKATTYITYDVQKEALHFLLEKGIL